MRKFPGSPKISTILPIGRNPTLPFLDVCLSFIKASSLALELWTGTCFVLAALMPPKQKKKVPPVICTPKVSNFWGAYHSRAFFFYKGSLDESAEQAGFDLCSVKGFRFPKSFCVVFDFLFTEGYQIAFII